MVLARIRFCESSQGHSVLTALPCDAVACVAVACGSGRLCKSSSDATQRSRESVDAIMLATQCTRYSPSQSELDKAAALLPMRRSTALVRNVHETSRSWRACEPFKGVARLRVAGAPNFDRPFPFVRGSWILPLEMCWECTFCSCMGYLTTRFSTRSCAGSSAQSHHAKTLSSISNSLHPDPR